MADNIIIKISSDIGSTENNGSGVTANQDKTTGGQKKLQEQQTPNKAGEKSVLDDFTKMLVIDQGKKMLQNVVAQYGNLTGNSMAQSRLQGVTTLAGWGTAIASAGWVGAIAVAIDIGTQAVNNAFELRRANAQIDLLRQRSGNSTLNGSRGTYD